MTGPSAASAGGTRVVLPAPGAAVNTSALRSRTSARISGTNASIGSGIYTVSLLFEGVLDGLSEPGV